MTKLLLHINNYFIKRATTIYKHTLRTRLVHCNDYYMEIRINITRNTLNWNVINITIH